MKKISIIGLGFVGEAMLKSFNQKITSKNLQKKYKINGYDKYKKIGSIEDCKDSDVIFTALPTLFDVTNKSYDNSPTYDVVQQLYALGYKNMLVIKSTVEPTFTKTISELYQNIAFVHNPEFLTARTAFDDFHNQKHIILGKGAYCSIKQQKLIKKFYRDLYEDADISECDCTESECVKIFCNTFYAVKVQYFNELYATTKSINCDYEKIVSLMLKNGWINPMHTNVPGPDGKLSYGGLCFTKDTLALLEFMKKHHTSVNVLAATVTERDVMRSDNDNIVIKNKKRNNNILWKT